MATVQIWTQDKEKGKLYRPAVSTDDPEGQLDPQKHDEIRHSLLLSTLKKLGEFPWRIFR